MKRYYFLKKVFISWKTRKKHINFTIDIYNKIFIKCVGNNSKKTKTNTTSYEKNKQQVCSNALYLELAFSCSNLLWIRCNSGDGNCTRLFGLHLIRRNDVRIPLQWLRLQRWPVLVRLFGSLWSDYQCSNLCSRHPHHGWACSSLNHPGVDSLHPPNNRNLYWRCRQNPHQGWAIGHLKIYQQLGFHCWFF